ncbi:hypothetical protein [Xanthomonas sacchari]|uniref:hypothetical protein n=1 Tax=Xanthomonas sacchari TaxID=56458 RepID=UPI0020C1D150|nr:hypothetical protein [Xanthomonas sacchari]
MKVVLVSSVPYSAHHESLLLSLIGRKINLFCATGTDCENWEFVFDLLLTDPDRNFSHDITTTSHPNEPIDDVVNFAKIWHVEGSQAVELIEVFS